MIQDFYLTGNEYRDQPAQLPVDPAITLLGRDSGVTLDFLTMRGAIVDRTRPSRAWSGDLSTLMTYVAPSIKYVSNFAGVLVPGTTLRCDHASDGAPLGLLLEPQRTNFCLRSEEFDSWIRRGSASITPNVEIAPDGQMTADLISGISTSTNDIYLTSSGHTASAALSPSIFLKRVSTSGLIYLQNSANPSIGRWSVNLSLLSNTWERITADHPAVTIINPWTATGAGLAGILITGQSGDPLSFHLWGAMLEQASFASSYIKTEAAQVTRAADNIYAMLNQFPFDFSDGFSMYAHIVSSAPRVLSNTYFARMTNSTTVSNLAGAYKNGAGAWQHIVRSGGATQAQVSLGSLSVYNGRYASRTFEADFAGSLNGAPAGEILSGSRPSSVDRLRLNTTGGASSHHLQKVLITPTRWDNATLQARSA
jgi:hypothetical protein